jgi:hypothetical protein
MDSLLRFTVGTTPFALPLDLVGELSEAPDCTAVPGAPPAIAGLADIRGRVITLVDLATLMETPPVPADARRTAVVLARPYSHLALLVAGNVEIVIPPSAVPNGADAETDDSPSADDGMSTSPGAEPTPPEGWDGILTHQAAFTLIDIPEVISQCTRQLRDRYRLPG